ncbi:MAG: endonuclease/exonuclease/phosphatase family protein [Kofleriaceae bacterium]
MEAPVAWKPFSLVNGEWKEAPRAATESPVALRVLTWNTWFGDHMFDERRAALLVELERRRPDVIALQEVTPDLLTALADAPWVRNAYQLSEIELWQRYDIALLARQPIRRLTALELPTQMGRRLLVAELACGLTVGTVHLESMKESSEPRARQLGLIQPYLAGLCEDTLLVGDMNFKPDDELETAALAPDLVDVWPQLHPEDPGYTADSERNPMRFALKPRLSRKRIDRVFLRGTTWKPTAIELVGTEPIDGDGTFISDHFGLEVTLAV